MDEHLQTARFHLEGMTCASCVARAERVLMAQPGVMEARVNLADERADLRFAAPATRAKLAEALTRAGYPPRQAVLALSVEGMSCAACTGRVERVLAGYYRDFADAPQTLLMHVQQSDWQYCKM